MQRFSYFAGGSKLAHFGTWHILALSLSLLGCDQETAAERERPELDGKELEVAPRVEQADAEGRKQDADAAQPVVEAVTEAAYFVRNAWSEEVQLAATDLAGQPVQLLVDRVAAHGTALIFRAREGSGGQVMPSNFFQNFTATREGALVHEGLRDYEWIREEGEHEVERYQLVLSPPVNYACEESADCTIKDVGNCCGYYPRCVNVDSPTPEPVCEPGVGSVCGWPVIIHCECVENLCRSKQDDKDV